MDQQLETYLKNNFFLKALERLSINNLYFYVKNTDLQYILVSPNIPILTGIKEEDILYKKDRDIAWGKTQGNLFNADDVFTIVTQKEHISEHIVHLKDKTLKIKTHKTPIVDQNGKSIGVLGILINNSSNNEI